jgi:hypothetical protein
MRLRSPLLASCALVLAVCALTPLAFATETTRAQYTEMVEPICKTNTKANERILQGVEKEVRQGKLKPAAAKFSKAAAELKKTLGQLRSVPPPPADKARVKEWLGGVKLESELFAAVAKKLDAGQKGAAEHMVALLNSNANKTNNVMLPFEFRYCRLEPSKFT